MIIIAYKTSSYGPSDWGGWLSFGSSEFKIIFPVITLGDMEGCWGQNGKTVIRYELLPLRGDMTHESSWVLPGHLRHRGNAHPVAYYRSKKFWMMVWVLVVVYQPASNYLEQNQLYERDDRLRRLVGSASSHKKQDCGFGCSG